MVKTSLQYLAKFPLKEGQHKLAILAESIFPLLPECKPPGEHPPASIPPASACRPESRRFQEYERDRDAEAKKEPGNGAADFRIARCHSCVFERYQNATTPGTPWRSSSRSWGNAVRRPSRFRTRTPSRLNPGSKV
jgi:hypothetical protein